MAVARREERIAMKRCLILLLLASCSLQPKIQVDPLKNESATSQPVDIRGDKNVAVPSTQTGWLNLSYQEVAGGGAALAGLMSWLWFSAKLAKVRKDTDFEEMRRENERHHLMISAFKDITLRLIEKR